MIVVEGPDGAGKTSLVARLRQDLNLPVADKVVNEDTEPIVDLADWTEANVSAGFQKVIFDRHRLISEPIYGPATRTTQDPHFLDLGWLSEMMWRFYQSQPIIIYCLPDLQVVRDNVKREDTNNSVISGRIAAIYAGYVARASVDFTSGRGRLFNYKTTRYEDILGWVQWKYNERVTQDEQRPPFPRQTPASRAAARGPRTEALLKLRHPRPLG